MSSENSLNESVRQHYTRTGLVDLIVSALEGAGKDLDDLELEDLAPIDEFHVRGREATVELAEAVELDAGKQVIDVGSGLGGASRRIAQDYGCRVTGVDLTDEYCRVAAQLAELVGLSHLVDYQQGDALDLPFPDAAFDIVWTQHAAMNIPDKATLYREMYRVLRPGGMVAIYDIVAGPTHPVLFPVPWAREADTSFLATPEELRQLLQDSGFTITGWEDTTAMARKWFTEMVKRIEETGLPPLGFHLLMGEDFAAMARNQQRNLNEGRIMLLQVVAKK